jgi:hypothetical protein
MRSGFRQFCLIVGGLLVAIVFAADAVSVQAAVLGTENMYAQVLVPVPVHRPRHRRWVRPRPRPVLVPRVVPVPVAPRPVYVPPPRAVYRSSQVLAVQQALNAQGYQLAEDGVMGAMTRDALKDFQYNNGLEATGAIDGPTLAQLGL